MKATLAALFIAIALQVNPAAKINAQDVGDSSSIKTALDVMDRNLGACIMEFYTNRFGEMCSLYFSEMEGNQRIIQMVNDFTQASRANGVADTPEGQRVMRDIRRQLKNHMRGLNLLTEFEGQVQ
jgi:hypothetical protein